MANAQIIAIDTCARKSKSPPPSGSRAKLYVIPGIEGITLPPQPPTLVIYESDAAWQQINIKLNRIEDLLPRLKGLGFPVADFEERCISARQMKEHFALICPLLPSSLMRTGTRKSYTQLTEDEAALGNQLKDDLFMLEYEMCYTADQSEDVEGVYAAIDFLTAEITEPRFLVARKKDSVTPTARTMIRFMANPARELSYFRNLAKQAVEAINDKQFPDAQVHLDACKEIKKIHQDVHNGLDPRLFVEVIAGGKK